MMAEAAKTDDRKKFKSGPKMRTPIVRTSWFQFLVPGKRKENMDKYGGDVVIEVSRTLGKEEATNELLAMKRAGLAVCQQAFGADIKYSQLVNPFKDGNTKRKKDKDGKKGEVYPQYKDTICFKLETKQKPGLVGPDGHALLLGDAKPEAGVKYSSWKFTPKAGDYVICSIVPFPWEQTRDAIVIENGVKRTEQILERGFKFYLQNIQMVRQGEAISTGGDPSSDFEAIDTGELNENEGFDEGSSDVHPGAMTVSAADIKAMEDEGIV